MEFALNSKLWAVSKNSEFEQLTSYLIFLKYCNELSKDKALDLIKNSYQK